MKRQLVDDHLCRGMLAMVVIQVLTAGCMAGSLFGATRLPPSPTEYPQIESFSVVEEGFSQSSEFINDLDWQPEGEALVASASRATFVYSLSTHTVQKLKDVPTSITQATWTSKGRLAGSEKRLWVWDTDNGIVYSPNREEEAQTFGDVFWSAKGDLLFSTFYPDLSKSYLVTWDIQNNKLTSYGIPGIENPVLLDWSPDRTTICIEAATERLLRLIDFAARTEIHSLGMHLDNTPICAWNPTGDRLAIESKDGFMGIWDTGTWQTTNILRNYQGDIRSVNWSSDGQYLAVAGEAGVMIWNISSGNFAAVQPERANAMAWSPDGALLAADSGTTVNLWKITHLP